MAVISTTDIELMEVNNVLGVPALDSSQPSNDLGTIIARAKSGGKDGYAFLIVENGSTKNDGYLMDNSVPYWNIWSNNSPGEWDVPYRSGINLSFRLKRDTDSSYLFDLSEFSGHNTNAAAPKVPSINYEIYRSGSSITLNLNLKGNFGDYDFTRVETVNKCKLILYDGGQEFASSPVINYSNSITLIFPVSFVMATTSTYTRVFTSKLALCNTLGDVVGEIPLEGEVVVSIADVPKQYVGRVWIGNMSKVFILGDVFNERQFTGTYREFAGVNANNLPLIKMVYEKINNTTGAVLSTLEVTSFNLWEGPEMTDVYKTGSEETFTFDNTRMYNDNNTYIRISWYY